MQCSLLGGAGGGASRTDLVTDKFLFRVFAGGNHVYTRLPKFTLPERSARLLNDAGSDAHTLTWSRLERSQWAAVHLPGTSGELLFLLFLTFSDM